MNKILEQVSEKSTSEPNTPVPEEEQVSEKSTSEPEEDFSYLNTLIEEAEGKTGSLEKSTSEPLNSTEDFSYLKSSLPPESPHEKALGAFEYPDQDLKDQLPFLPEVKELWDKVSAYSMDELKRGWENSLVGMKYREKLPSPESQDGWASEWYKHVPAGVVAGTLDFGYYMGAFALGTAVTGGNPIAGGAASFAIPAGLRKSYIDKLEKGEIKDAQDFAYRIGGALKASADEGLIGATMVASGGLVGPVLKAPTELVAMTVASSILHQEMPTLEDFASNAAIITGLHYTNPVGAAQYGINKAQKIRGSRTERLQGNIEKNLRHLYEEQGIHPKKVMQDMQEDPSILFDLMARKKKIPRAYREPIKELRPEDVTNLKNDIDEGLLDGVDIWKYTRKTFDELHRNGKGIYGFLKQAKYQIGKKIIDTVGTDDFQKIADYYKEKYLLPVDIKVTMIHIPVDGGGNIALGQTSFPEGTANTFRKRGFSDATAPAKIEINEVASKHYGKEEMVSTLRHEIEHLLDMHKGWSGTTQADWRVHKDTELRDTKTPADLVRVATDDTVGLRHHKVYDNFELDYLHRAMVRDALERGEKVPVEVLKDYPDLQEYTKVRADQKIVFEPGKDDKAPLDFKETAKQSVSTFYELLIDDLNPVKEMEKDMYGAKGAFNLPAERSVYKASLLIRGVLGHAKHYFELGGYDRLTGKKNSVAFKKIIDKIKPEEHDTFVEWIVMQRAVELESMNLKSGFENVADKHRIVAEGKARGFDLIFDELRTYQLSLLKHLVDAELLSPKVYEAIKTKHRYYVPFYRDIAKFKKAGGVKGASMETGTLVYRYKGSSAPVINPLYSIVENTFSMLRAAENNKVLLRLVRDIRKVDKKGKYVQAIASPLKVEREGSPKEGESPKGFIIRIDGGESGHYFGKIEAKITKGDNKGTYKVKVAGNPKPIYITDKSILKWEGKQTKGTKVKSSKEVKSTTLVDDVERIAERVNKSIEDLTPKDFIDGFATIKVHEHGKVVEYRISEDIATTFKNLDVKIDKIFKMFSGPARTLRAGAIMNPDFPVSNAWKDQLDAFAYAKYGFTPIATMVKGLFIRKGQGEVYSKWLQSGGYNAVLVAMDKPYLGKRMYKELQSLPVHNKMNFSKNPLHYLRILSELSEESTRLGLFNRALKKGASVEDAAFESRTTTIDFQRAGIIGRKYNVITAFFNVAWQGNAKLIEMLRYQPVRTMRRLFFSVTLPSIVNTLINYDDESYHAIPRWQRDLFWCVKVNGNWLRLPKPFIAGTLFGTLPERLLEAYLAENNADRKVAVENVGKVILDAFTPPISPTIAVPGAESLKNEDFFTGHPLISQDLEGILPEYQYTPSTGTTSRLISKGIQYVPFIGGAEMTSPIHVRHFIEKWTGGLGRLTLNLVDSLLDKAGVQLDDFDVEAPAKYWYEQMPILRSFVVRDDTSASAHVHRFFDNYEKYKKIGKTIGVEKERWNYNNVAHLMSESDLEILQGSYESLLNIFSTIRGIERLPTLAGQDTKTLSLWKRQQIEEAYKQANIIAIEGNKLMNSLEEHKEANQAAWDWHSLKVH
jgi:hypothetical protein